MEVSEEQPEEPTPTPNPNPSKPVVQPKEPQINVNTVAPRTPAGGGNPAVVAHQTSTEGVVVETPESDEQVTETPKKRGGFHPFLAIRDFFIMIIEAIKNFFS